MLNVIDEFTHECLAIRVARKLKAIDVIDVLSDLFILRGVPGHIRSDNGPEFIAKAVQEWISAVGAKTAYKSSARPEGGAQSRYGTSRDCSALPRPRSLSAFGTRTGEISLSAGIWLTPRTAMRGFGRRLHHRRRAARTIGCEKRSGSRSYVRSRGGKWTNSSSLPFTRSSQGP